MEQQGSDRNPPGLPIESLPRWVLSVWSRDGRAFARPASFASGCRHPILQAGWGDATKRAAEGAHDDGGGPQRRFKRCRTNPRLAPREQTTRASKPCSNDAGELRLT
jgi:hypothetical protein